MQVQGLSLFRNGLCIFVHGRVSVQKSHRVYLRVRWKDQVKAAVASAAEKREREPP